MTLTSQRSQTRRHPRPRSLYRVFPVNQDHEKKKKSNQETRMSGRFPQGNESRICPGQFGNTAHAALIKSRSGCPPRKQITMIIPNGHPLTALKHPSIKAPFQLFHPLQTKISLLLSVMCHYSHRSAAAAAAAAPLCSLRWFHSSRCVNCLPQRLKKTANSLTCTDMKAARNT